MAGVDIGLAVEQEAAALGAGLESLDAQGLGLDLQAGEAEQGLDGASGKEGYLGISVWICELVFLWVTTMIHADIRQRLIEESRSLPDDLLQEVVDFMEFIRQKRESRSGTRLQEEQDAWKRDFRSISVWPEDHMEAKVESWTIESF